MTEAAHKTTVAAIQMVSTPDVATNMSTARRLVTDAANHGANLALLPEYWAIMGRDERDKLAVAEVPGEGPIQQCMADLARQHRLWLIGGTLPLRSPDAARVLNTTLVYNPAGECVGRYDKIHLFGFCNGNEQYDEANTIVAGRTPSTVQTAFGRVGLSVCYDLRFPELYRAMGDCTLLVVPAAFTYTTGQAHWEILLRARAIENQCYVLAAAQGGQHLNGRRTWGHSLLIDPWGTIVAEKYDDGEGLISGDLDLEQLRDIRTRLPALQHRVL